MCEHYKTIITPEAQQDVRQIVLYIAGELCAPGAALRLQDEFEKGIQSLERNPGRIIVLDENPWGDLGIRKVRVRNYYVYFWIDDQRAAVWITGVIYVGRDQVSQLEKKRLPDQ